MTIKNICFYCFIVSMKKYFLLTVLFVYLFLWLGSFSLGQDLTELGQNWTPIDLWSSNSYDPWSSSNTSTPTNPNPVQTYEVTNDTDTTPTNSEVTTLTNISCDQYTDSINCNIQSICKWNSSLKKCQSCSDPNVCCGVELNTNVPFIGKCIEDESSNDPTAIKTSQAFPVLMSSLTKILVTAILIVSFVLIVVWGIMISTGNPSWGKKMIIKVVMGIALLGASGVILRLINPNFFG